MRVIFVSQCSKQALTETRRILDQFAERKGDCVWQTHITTQGLETIKKLLKKSARKNTAVACHQFRGHHLSELCWIVGNARKFNSEGSVPTNTTQREILRTNDENNWNTGYAIAILSSLAGLFHDFGKASELFQNKLQGKSKTSYEPIRHEWISLWLFEQFIGSSSDEQWLTKLSKICLEDEHLFLNNFPKDNNIAKNPLDDLPPIAKCIGWLILSHHRLPRPYLSSPRADEIDKWMHKKQLDVRFNSRNYDKKSCGQAWNEKEKILNTDFACHHASKGLPVRSLTWRRWAQRTAKLALKNLALLEKDWFEDRFSLHLCRLSLMLADHLYSSSDSNQHFQDPAYKVYANTDRETKKFKQHLDEHNIGVAYNSFFTALSLPNFYRELPSITRHPSFKRPSKNRKFAWQDDAYNLCYNLKKKSDNTGFFGVNLASTGTGKTLANARIMYALASEKKGCRFTVALGLRVLTLQTGQALKEKLSLKEDDVAVTIGADHIRELHKLQKEINAINTDKAGTGSDSCDDLNENDDYISYEGSLADGRIGRWLKKSPKLHKLISAPILACTIDQLIHATEGYKGGKQIAPILRLLTSDVIFDEPDDFDVKDLPALCRLVNFAGVFGSKVLLSSATLTPAIVEALFEAYSAGRRQYNKNCRPSFVNESIQCCWFDEFHVATSQHLSLETFKEAHQDFVARRISNLEKLPTLRKAFLAEVTEIPMTTPFENKKTSIAALAEAIGKSLYNLHDKHNQIAPTGHQKVSIGLIRIANITQLVAIAKELLARKTKEDYAIHFCIYHSQFPLLVRSKTEEILDRILARHCPEKIWGHPEIKNSLKKDTAKNHIFVVFATSVAEVGRDHDYDWAIIEPSSLRSIVQLAGRIKRHRQQETLSCNIAILSKNFKGCIHQKIAFNNPGFESDQFKLPSKNLNDILDKAILNKITAIPRLQENNEIDNDTLISIEHQHIRAKLFDLQDSKKRDPFHASLWWKHNPDWCAHLQSKTPFRENYAANSDYFFLPEEASDTPKIYKYKNDGSIASNSKFFDETSFQASNKNYSWFSHDLASLVEELEEFSEMSSEDLWRMFSKFSLRDLTDNSRWSYDINFGFYQDL